jgi:3',5'-cyclic AMP phosphodiesterase CpdA
MILIAHLTDCHVTTPGRQIFGVVDTAARLGMAVRFLNGLTRRPDLVVLTGDLVDRGLPEEYEHLRGILAALEIPFYLVPGNHDNRDVLRASFPDHDYLPRDGFLNWTLEAHGGRFIGIDSVIPGQPDGEICAVRAAWLDDQLQARTNLPTFLFMHHPPFLTGVEALDEMACRGADRLAAVVRRHPHVEGLFCGHHHQPFVTQWAGILAVMAPATAQQMVAGFAAAAEPQWNLEPAACMLHRWRRSSGLVTRVATVEPVPGPYFYAAGVTRNEFGFAA